ncbi:hypothetical protein DMX10_22375 [Pseudomonas sp. 57B-090624]|uniref:TniQ family protein n=1 Tax=Pseudomonas sp. 57B-090624 TaxID=2213080 RepID=UPI000DA92FC7|nr:hypothetical protein DMX10_22375 [Pseudomonas sp. 57B-090624]
METSYTWHSGARCVDPRWPLTPTLLPDELLSSWLVRTALAHGCRPDTLTRVVWPGTRAWTCDLDRPHPWANLAALASMAGLSAEMLLATTLWPIVLMLHPNAAVHNSSWWPWILPLGCRSRTRAGGLLCCPHCMAGPIPHYRQQYRLAWHTACPWHHVLLIDRCTSCHSAIQPGRLGVDGKLSECHHCGQSLDRAPPVPVVDTALAFQNFVDARRQSTIFYGQVALSFSEWMCVARVMVSYLETVARQPSAGSRLFCERIGVDLARLKSSSLGLPFEYAAPAERAGLLGQAWVIMQAGPERFVELATETKLPVTAFPLPVTGVPEILMQMVSVLSQHTRHKLARPVFGRTREPLEVWHMWHRLQRRTRRNGIS